MMLLDGPSLTKKVPAIEVRIDPAQIASGYIIALPSAGVPAKKIAASTMVATTVTA